MNPLAKERTDICLLLSWLRHLTSKSSSMKFIERLLMAPFITLLLLSVGLVFSYCILKPYEIGMPVGLTALAVLATFCGLCLRLASVIGDAEDKALALQSGEKCFIAVVLFASMLSLKVSFDLLGTINLPGFDLTREPFMIMNSIILFIIAAIVLLIFIGAMIDLGKLMASRVNTWKK